MEKRYINYLKKAGIAAACVAGVWLFFLSLPYILPFLIALLLARFIEPAVLLMQDRLRFPRALCCAIITIVVVAALIGALVAIISALISELTKFVTALPDMLEHLPSVMDGWQERVESWINAAPPSLQSFLRSSLDSISAGSANISSSLYTAAVSFISSTAAALPKILLFTITTVMSLFFISSDYPKIVKFLMLRLTPARQASVRRIKDKLLSTMGKWLKAQGILMVISFFILFAGLLMLRADYALLIAMLTAVLDALPVLGAGMILIPWAAVMFLTGETVFGIGLLLLFGAQSLTRGIIEPKIIGSQVGLSPLITLMAMYIGFSLFGIAGMIILPILAMMASQFIKAR